MSRLSETQLNQPFGQFSLVQPQLFADDGFQKQNYVAELTHDT